MPIIGFKDSKRVSYGNPGERPEFESPTSRLLGNMLCPPKVYTGPGPNGWWPEGTSKGGIIPLKFGGKTPHAQATTIIVG